MSKNNRESKSTDLLACPCCGYGTLASRNEFEICEICWWEDDGQDNNNASQVLGGPNSNLSLTRARFNFLKYGIFDPKRVDLRSRPRVNGRVCSISYLRFGWGHSMRSGTCRGLAGRIGRWYALNRPRVFWSLLARSPFKCAPVRKLASNQARVFLDLK